MVKWLGYVAAVLSVGSVACARGSKAQCAQVTHAVARILNVHAQTNMDLGRVLHDDAKDCAKGRRDASRYIDRAIEQETSQLALLRKLLPRLSSVQRGRASADGAHAAIDKTNEMQKRLPETTKALRAFHDACPEDGRALARDMRQVNDNLIELEKLLAIDGHGAGSHARQRAGSERPE